MTSEISVQEAQRPEAQRAPFHFQLDALERILVSGQGLSVELHVHKRGPSSQAVTSLGIHRRTGLKSRRRDWSPRGACTLPGPSGSGVRTLPRLPSDRPFLSFLKKKRVRGKKNSYGLGPRLFMLRGLLSTSPCGRNLWRTRDTEVAEGTSRVPRGGAAAPRSSPRAEAMTYFRLRRHAVRVEVSQRPERRLLTHGEPPGPRFA